ncbi:MAG: OmpA family protein [Fimbriimonadaceae bacterium]|nr:OmpA family protein [Fimbriimonadaceae bacterium]
MRESQPIIIKRKKVVAGGHHGGSWKVAYADFVTAMMAFFMVMWIMGLSADQRASIAHYFNDPFSAIKSADEGGMAFGLGFPDKQVQQGGKSGGGAESLVNKEADAKTLIDGLSAALKTLDGKPEVKALIDSIEFQATDEGVRMEFLEKNGAAFFEIGSAEIRPAAKTLIARIAPFLATADRDIVIEGHTDARPLHNGAYDNLDLSNDRAAAMKRALVASGVKQNQIKRLEGFGDSHLYKPSDPFHWSNRRVSVLLPWEQRTKVVGDDPKQLMDRQVQGMFRETYQIAPPRPDVVNEGRKLSAFEAAKKKGNY